MSHELAHVATDAARSGTEPWLVEGFADYVALRDTNLPDGTTLGRAIAAARRDGVPEDLPAAADFDTRAADLQARYEEAWLACRIIAERLGERGLVSVYDAAAEGVTVKRALADLGLPLTEVTARLACAARSSGWVSRGAKAWTALKATGSGRPQWVVLVCCWPTPRRRAPCGCVDSTMADEWCCQLQARCWRL